MKLSDFDFDLPDELIATRPARPRSSARLLVAQAQHISDHIVSGLPDFLNEGDRLVLNNTRVIPARLCGHRRRGAALARIEVTLMEAVFATAHDSASRGGQSDWRAMARPLRKLEVGEKIEFSDHFWAEVKEKTSGDLILSFNCQGDDFDKALFEHGAMPLPPYIGARRRVDEQDNVDYQSVFAQEVGAVAAPTASLHFDHALLNALKAKGVAISEVTLHVGAGTFLPVKVDNIKTHKMHAEWGVITPKTAAEIIETKTSGGKVIPVGTTALRLLETAARLGVLAPWEGKTDIFIYPGFRFFVADGLMTNFHLPKSTLMMLVCALMGKENIDQIYAHAIRERYRFFSYGDASLLLP